MEDKEYQIREVFAYYGRSMYLAQTVEKGLTQLLIGNHNRLTKDRYDELLAEKSQLTFGQIKRELINNKVFCEDILNKIDSFHKNRDWLAHNFWWDRALEFFRDDLRYKLIVELDKLTFEFNELHNIIQIYTKAYLKNYGLDLIDLVQEFSLLESSPKTPLICQLSKNETINGIFTYTSIENVVVPIFLLENKFYWTLCEIGLTQFRNEDIEEDINPINELQGIFPIKQFNPRPKIRAYWDYDLELKKNGYFIEIKPSEIDRSFVFKWAIKTH